MGTPTSEPLGWRAPAVVTAAAFVCPFSGCYSFQMSFRTPDPKLNA